MAAKNGPRKDMVLFGKNRLGFVFMAPFWYLWRLFAHLFAAAHQRNAAGISRA
jgi:hypothetical protein